MQNAMIHESTAFIATLVVATNAHTLPLPTRTDTLSCYTHAPSHVTLGADGGVMRSALAAGCRDAVRTLALIG